MGQAVPPSDLRPLRAGVAAAARDMLRENGYMALSVEGVAQRLGMSPAHLAAEFSRKETLVLAVLDLLLDEVFGALPEQTDWRRQYETALDRLLAAHQSDHRCIGLMLCAARDETATDLRNMAADFFLDLRLAFRDVLAPNVGVIAAEAFAVKTVTAVEGARLWRDLYGNSGPMEAVRARLLAQAESLADDRLRPRLGQGIGDWRRVSAS